MAEIYIAGAVRTAIGKFGGTLAETPAVDLGVAAAIGALKRANVDPKSIDEVFFGHARQANCGPNPARQVASRAGVPYESPAMTVNQACASGLRSIALAFGAIAAGERSTCLVGGMESMSNTPYMLPRARWGYRLGHGELTDGMYKDGFHCPIADQLMGRTAENLAEQYNISRDEQDQYAVESQHRAGAAQSRHAEDMVAVSIKGPKGQLTDFLIDEHVRADATLTGMAKLPSVFKKEGTVHAGNSSGITDGAAAAIVLSGESAKRLGVKPLARIVDFTVVGVDPKIMGIGPVPAVRKLIERTGIGLDKIDLIELNEAFAAQVIACQRDLKLDMSRVNVNGGAIALGHPIGCTGARITVTLLNEMVRRNARYGLATLCVSGGMGIAMLFERA